MGWAPDPTVTRAADEAAAEAQEAIRRRLDAHANAAMSPFERKLLGVLEDLRDAVKSPGADPVLATLESGTPWSVADRIMQSLPPGSVVTGPNGPILAITPLTGVPTETADGLARLADASPTDLGIAVRAAGLAVFLEFGDVLTSTVLAERIAEAAIDAALHVGLTTSAGQDGARQDGAAGADPPSAPAEPPH